MKSGDLGTQDFSWHKSNTGVKGRNICHLAIVVTHITGHYFEPGDENTRVDVPEKILYHKYILGKWAKEHCLTAPITFNQGDGQWSLNIPIEGDRYEVKNFHKYVPNPIKRQAVKDINAYFEDKKTNYPHLVKENVSTTFTTFVCGAKLELSQVSLNDHYEILHSLRIKAMDKYSFIKIDTT